MQLATISGIGLVPVPMTLRGKGRTMGFDFALDELYATGWSDLDSNGCSHHSDGRAFPRPERVRQEFQAAGFDLIIESIAAFNCFRAHWNDPETGQTHAVVGHSEAEAAVFALAQFRRQTVNA